MRSNGLKKIAVTKKGRKFVVSDKNTGMKLYQLMDAPTYAYFNLDNPILSGIASINLAGNSFSFNEYLKRNDDRKAIRSDWEKVGVAFWKACYLFQNKLENEKQTVHI